MNTRSIRFRLTVWYAGLLAGLLLLFGVSVYLGLGHYLKRTLADSLTKEARQIGEALLVNISLSGEAYVVDEIKEHLAPELNGRFVRVTRADGSTLYESGLPKDGSFDPANVTAAPNDASVASSREEHLPGGGELMVCTVPYASRDKSRFVIEIGASLKQSERASRFASYFCRGAAARGCGCDCRRLRVDETSAGSSRGDHSYSRTNNIAKSE